MQSAAQSARGLRWSGQMELERDPRNAWTKQGCPSTVLGAPQRQDHSS